MIKFTLFAGIAAGTAFFQLSPIASELDEHELPIVSVVRTFESNESPEGIGIDNGGNLFVGLRTTDGSTFISNRVVRILPSGKQEMVADMGAVDPGMSGILGLTTDKDGNILFAFGSGDERHGVWKVSPKKEKTHFPGSEKIIVPNAITLDGEGNVYVTDSDPMEKGMAGIWHYYRDSGVFEPWCGDPLVRPAADNPNGGTPLPGANGIVFIPPDNLYVANTEKSLVAHVQIQKDGSAGSASMAAGNNLALMNPDGLVVDLKGNLYTVLPIASVDLTPEMGGPLPPLSPVVKIIPETGKIEPLVDVNTFPDAEYFDFPTSLAVGRGMLSENELFIVSMGAVNYNFPKGTGPKVTRFRLRNTLRSCEQ